MQSRECTSMVLKTTRNCFGWFISRLDRDRKLLFMITGENVKSLTFPRWQSNTGGSEDIRINVIKRLLLPLCLPFMIFYEEMCVSQYDLEELMHQI